VPGVKLPDDAVIVARLRARDEAMFAALLDAWSPGMLRVARTYVADEYAAQDVVQDTWLGVLRGIDSFESRSALRTWAYRILVNRAITRASRDTRVIPAAALTPTAEDHGPTVDPARFRTGDDPYPGHWRSQPERWPTPESEVLAQETRRYLAAALEQLPARQRIVVVLRDVEEYSSAQVCEILQISPANQRVLLHRGRAALRTALEERFAKEVPR
jgi:RNA polymerase sigma-70 factor (ECF subfamily)